MVAQARLVEAYERSEWPRTAPTVPVLLAYLTDQHGLSRADLARPRQNASRLLCFRVGLFEPSFKFCINVGLCADSNAVSEHRVEAARRL